MKAFTKYRGRSLAIMNDNIDTDIIIAKQYLKTTKRSGFADFAFSTWRYDENGEKLKDFPLNKSEHMGASILITGENFGCGSSREHAAWALQDLGIRVIIAGGYSDIFYNNWLNNGNVPIVLSREEREKLSKLKPDKYLLIDLENQLIESENLSIDFDFPDVWKDRLIHGVDSIDITLKSLEKIEKYEKKIEG